MASELHGEQGGDLPVAAARQCGVPQMADVAAAVEPGAGEQRSEAFCLAAVCGFPGACGVCCFWAGDDAKGRG